MKRRRMSALQRKYFGKHKKRRVYAAAPVKRRYVTMARRRKGGFRGHASSRVGGFKSMIAPIVGGVADSYLDPMLPIDGLGCAAVGMFMKNNTVRDVGLIKVGFSLGNVLPLPRLGGGTGSGGSFT